MTAFVISIVAICVFIYLKDKFGFNNDIRRADKMFQKEEMLETKTVDNIDVEAIPENYYKDDKKITDIIKKFEEKNKNPLTEIIQVNNDSVILFVPYWFYYSFEGYTELYEYNLKNRTIKKIGWINEYYQYAKFKNKNKNTIIIYDGYITKDLLDGKMDKLENPILIFLK